MNKNKCVFKVYTVTPQKYKPIQYNNTVLQLEIKTKKILE